MRGSVQLELSRHINYIHPPCPDSWGMHLWNCKGVWKILLHELRGTWNWRNCPAVSPCWLPSKSGRWQTTSFFHYWDLKPCSSGSAGLMLPYIHLNLSLNLSALQSKDKRSCLPIKYIIAKLRPVWDERHGCLKTKLGRRTFSSLWKLHPIY